MTLSSKPPPDDALLRLFRDELRTHGGVIAAWLDAGAALEGEHVPDAVKRAVHSIGGAARIIDSAALRQLADAMERCLDAWPGLPPPMMTGAREVLANANRYLARLEGSQALPDDFALENQRESSALEAALDAIAVSDSLSPDDSAPPRRPHKRTRERSVDQSMLELFRTETEQCVAILARGLVTLENQTPTASDWEEWMRAAHSLKGAARILELVNVAQLAHVLEECLLGARSARLVLSSSDVDLLLQAVDSIKGAARIVADRLPGGRAQVETAALVTAQRLSALARRSAIAASLAGAVAETPRESSLPRVSPVPVAIPLRLSRAPVVFHVQKAFEQALTSRSMPARSIPAPSRRPPPYRPRQPRSGERVLRVAADSMERLMGLAGESLVESRRVASFARGLQRMRKRHSALIDILDAIERSIAGLPAAAEARERCDEARTEAREYAASMVQHAGELDSYIRRAEVLGESLYREALKSRMRPFADGTAGFPRLTRDLARELGKRVRLEISGESTEVDRDVLDGLEGPLSHLVRNALDHGIESPEQRARQGKPEIALCRIEAHHHAGMLSIAVSDDGRGIDPETIRAEVVERGLTSAALAANLSAPELFEFLFLPGFSTAPSVSEISGRGVGLDVVRTSVEALGGTARVHSEPGVGCTFHLQLPVTRSVVRAVVAEIAAEAYAFPLLRIERIDRVPVSDVKRLENRPYFMLDGVPIALIGGRDALGLSGSSTRQPILNVIVVGDEQTRFGLVVDELRGEHDLVVRPLDPRLGKVQDIAAAAILSDGWPALIVDVDDLMRSIDRMVQGAAAAEVDDAISAPPAAARKRVLVVDDSIMVREAERQLLVNRGYEVDVAVDGVDGLNTVRRGRYDLVITDIDMPRMNGIELVRSIKEDPALRAIPVVIVSYKDREEDRMRGLSVGANYYLSKSSFHDDKLVEAVEDLVGAAS